MDNRMSCGFREKSPCKDCTERFLACCDKCPKDARGEYGYKAWKEKLHEVEEARKLYYKLRRKKW